MAIRKQTWITAMIMGKETLMPTISDGLLMALLPPRMTVAQEDRYNRQTHNQPNNSLRWEMAILRPNHVALRVHLGQMAVQVAAGGSFTNRITVADSIAQLRARTLNAMSN